MRMAMSGEELVRRAISFEKPERAPIYYFNKDKDRSDIVARGLTLGSPGG